MEDVAAPMTRVGVLLTAFGGPDCLDAVGPFMCSLMGREPSEELVERARRKYMAIGGSSPLPGIARGVARALEEQLSADGDIPVRVGMRYAKPFIADSLADLASLGVRRVVTVSLSPFESKVASGAYREAVAEGLRELPGLEVVEAPMLHEARSFATALADACREAVDELKDYERRLVVFSAHSLPVSDLTEDDPYVREIRAVTETVAGLVGLGAGEDIADDARLPVFATFGNLSGEVPWVFAYQSKGARPGEWLGPDIEDVVEAAAAAGFTAVASCPVGFATDHMETMYDLDVVVADKVLTSGMEFARAAVPNDSAELMDALTELVSPLLDEG